MKDWLVMLLCRFVVVLVIKCRVVVCIGSMRDVIEGIALRLVELLSSSCVSGGKMKIEVKTLFFPAF
jgi:hypothetical protein